MIPRFRYRVGSLDWFVHDASASASLNGFPVNAAEFAAVGLSSGTTLGVRGCQESSGNLADLSGGGITLTASGTVVYGQTATGTNRTGVGFDGAAEEFAASAAGTYDIDATTSLTVAIAFACPDAPASTAGIVGKRDTGAPLAGWYGRANTDGTIRLIVDDGPDSVGVPTTLSHCDGAMHGLVFVIDRGTDEIRIHTDLEDVTQSMGGVIGTLTNTQTYRLGAITGSAGSGEDVHIFYEAVMVGAAWTATDFANWWATRN